MPGLFRQRFHAQDALISIPGDFAVQITFHIVIQDEQVPAMPVGQPPYRKVGQYERTRMTGPAKG